MLKLDWAVRRDPTGAPDRIASAERSCLAVCTAASPRWTCAAATTTSTTTAATQITRRAITTTVIFRRLEDRFRPGLSVRSGASGRSALGSPGSPFFTAGSVLR